MIVTPDRIVVGEREKSGNLLLWIPGKIVRKSNQRQLRRRKNGKPIITKSDAALNWTAFVCQTMPDSAKRGLGKRGEFLHIDFWCLYKTPRNPSHEPDLSVELILDGLQKSGVITNDRYVYSYTAKKVMGAIEGVIVEIRVLDPEAWPQEASGAFEGTSPLVAAPPPPHLQEAARLLLSLSSLDDQA